MDPDTYFDLFLYDASGPGGGRTAPGPVALWQTWWRVRSRVLLREHPELASACTQGFVLRTSQLPGLGVTRQSTRVRLRGGAWSAPQPKSVAVLDPPVEIGSSDPSDRFVVERRRHALACAAAVALNPGFVVGGLSAAILHGLPTVAVPARPHLVAPASLRAHRRGKAAIDEDEITRWYGIPVLVPARTVIDVARHDRREGIVVSDAALREALVDADELQRTLERCRGWVGVRAAREIVRLADPLGESPLESLTRLAVLDDDFPEPELQVEFAVSGSRRPYRVDLYWPRHRLILECDGRVKYSKDQRWREKRRELALERAGNEVERVVWSDVMHEWPQTSARLRAYFR